MKKTLLILLLVFLSFGMLFATSESFAQTSLLIDKKLKPQTIKLIEESAASLSSTEKMLLIEQHKSKTTAPFLLNLFLGAGIGSFVQGDIKHGVIFIATDVVDIIAVSSLSMFLTNELSSPYPTMTDQQVLGVTAALIACSAVEIGMRIWECVQPFVYAKDYNAKLTNALNVPAIAVVPVENNGNIVPMLTAKISF